MTQAENSRNTEQPASGPAFPCHPEIIQMMDRHTPGPWKVSMNQIKSNYDTVAQVFTHLVQGRHEVNARLIAAAPELLDFAKNWLSSQGSDDNYMTAKARAIITKATGEPQ